MTDGCVSSRLLHDCEGEAACGFYGLPHVLCVPVPPYAAHRARESVLTVETDAPEGGEAPLTTDAVPAQDRLSAGPKARPPR